MKYDFWKNINDLCNFLVEKHQQIIKRKRWFLRNGMNLGGEILYAIERTLNERV